MNTFTKNAARLLQGVAALSVAAAGLAFAPLAQAQTGTVSITNCSATNSSLTGFTWNGSSLTVTCAASSGGPGPTPATIDPLAGTFALVSCGGSWSPFAGAVSVSGGGTFTACVVRQNGWIGDYNVPWTAVGSGTSASPASGTVSFGDKDGAPRAFSFTLGSTTGTVTVQLGTPSPISTPSLTTTSSGSATVNVQGAAVVTQPSGNWQTDPLTPQVSCSTTASVVAPVFYTFNAQKQLFTLLPGQTGAIPFIAGSPPSAPFVQATETVSTPATADGEVSISPCPGDFSMPRGVCRADYSFNGGVVYMNTNGTNSSFACGLVPGNKYYANVRQVFRGTTDNSCPSNAQGGADGRTPGCDVKLQMQGM